MWYQNDKTMRRNKAYHLSKMVSWWYWEYILSPRGDITGQLRVIDYFRVPTKRQIVNGVNLFQRHCRKSINRGRHWNRKL